MLTTAMRGTTRYTSTGSLCMTQKPTGETEVLRLQTVFQERLCIVVYYNKLFTIVVLGIIRRQLLFDQPYTK